MALCCSWFDINGVADGSMIKQQGISRLLHDLHEVYYELFAMDLHKRLSLYHRNSCSASPPDIFTSLSNCFGRLAEPNRADGDGATSSTGLTSRLNPARSDHDHRQTDNTQAPNETDNGLNGSGLSTSWIRPADRYIGDKLRDSTWSHIHAATLLTRQGDDVNARLHATIANQALKEAAHYMSEEDYTILCDEVSAGFNELSR